MVELRGFKPRCVWMGQVSICATLRATDESSRPDIRQADRWEQFWLKSQDHAETHHHAERACRLQACAPLRSSGFPFLTGIARRGGFGTCVARNEIVGRMAMRRAHAASSAWSRSWIRSEASSMPTETRTSWGIIPAARRTVSGTEAWLIVQGCPMRLSTPPSDSASAK
jgi:hypothetical protein